MVLLVRAWCCWSARRRRARAATAPRGPGGTGIGCRFKHALPDVLTYALQLLKLIAARSGAPRHLVSCPPSRQRACLRALMLCHLSHCSVTCSLSSQVK